MKVGMLHFSGPPTVGGVEQTLYFHSLALADRGHLPRLIVGIGDPFDSRVEVRVIPEIYSKHPQVLAAKAELDGGLVSESFWKLRHQLVDELATAAQGLDRLIAHNALTLHKNLALTAALHQLHASGDMPPLVGWNHDLAWDRPGYLDELHPGEPWDLLRKPWPGVAQVAVSAAQQVRLAELFGINRQEIRVIPPGLDLAAAGRWTSPVRDLVSQCDLHHADLILLLPARITRRKNIEFGLHVHAALRSLAGQDVRLLISGPPGPHNPQNAIYAQELEELADELGTSGSVHFLSTMLEEDLMQDSMAALYLLSDALLFPSREEGFGIPILEAAYARMPIFCSDIPPFRESAQAEAYFFDLDDSPGKVAAQMYSVMESDPRSRFRRRVRDSYTWSGIVDQALLPLLEGLRDG